MSDRISKDGFLQAYNRDVYIVGVGVRGCLVAFKSGRISGVPTPVPFDSISWKSPDWFDEDVPRVRLRATA